MWPVCGEIQGGDFPGLYLLQSEAKVLGDRLLSNEFVGHPPPKSWTAAASRCPSLKATPETVELLAGNQAGAVTIAMTGSTETGMVQVGPYVVTYSNGDNQVYSDSNQPNALRIGFELLNQFEGYEKLSTAMEAYRYIDEIVAEEGNLCPLQRVGGKI